MLTPFNRRRVVRRGLLSSCAYQASVLPWLFAPPPPALGATWEVARGFLALFTSPVKA